MIEEKLDYEARLDKNYYFADSLGKKRSTYLFWQKSFEEWFLKSYKRLIICKDFKQFIQYFFFLNSSRRTW